MASNYGADDIHVLCLFSQRSRPPSRHNTAAIMVFISTICRSTETPAYKLGVPFLARLEAKLKKITWKCRVHNLSFSQTACLHTPPPRPPAHVAYVYLQKLLLVVLEIPESGAVSLTFMRVDRANLS